MTDGTSANWHPDPYGRHQLRYWDGSSWTEHVSNNGVAAVDPLAPVAPTPPIVPVQPASMPVSPGPAPAHNPPPGSPNPYVQSDALATNGSKFPVVPVVLGVVVAAAVIGGLLFFLGGDDDGGTTNGELTRDEPVLISEIELKAGEGMRFLAIPRGDADQDLVVVIAMDQDDSLRAREAAVPDENWEFSDIERDDVFSDIFSDSDSRGADNAGFGSGDYYEIFETDDNNSGGAEADVFVSPIDATLKVIVYDYDGERGEVELLVEKWDGNLDYEDDGYFSAFEGLTSDEAFFMSDDPFFDILSEDFDEFNETS